MNISALSNINFKSNTPVYHVYNTDKDGTITELDKELVGGPVLSLVKRLNKKDTKEHDFFSRYITDYRYFPLTTGTYIGSNETRKSTILYGQDALNVKEFRDLYYKTDETCYTKEDINNKIKELYITPSKKRAIHAPTGEQLGLVLHTKTKGDSYKLVDVKFVTPQGHIIAEMSKDIPESQQKTGKTPEITQKQIEEPYYEALDDDEAEYYYPTFFETTKAKEEYPPRPEELEEEFARDDEDEDDDIKPPLQPQKLIQGELFSTIA